MMTFILLVCLLASLCLAVVDSINVCRMKKEVGPCSASKPRWYFDSQPGMCRKFIYGGCRGNDNNFISEHECQSICKGRKVCQLPAEKGRCRARMPRYSYSQRNGRCEMFIYGGCGGNQNNFKSKADCKGKCAQRPIVFPRNSDT